MQIYELTTVLPGKTTAARKKDLVSKIEKMVKAAEGKVLAKDDWGVKDLAYTIKKNVAGAYLYFDLELPSSFVSSLNDKLKVEDDIIRYLLVRQEKRGKEEKKRKAK